MIRKIFIAGMLFAAAGSTSYAYELGTHGALTYEAYKRSVLTDADFLKQLGVVNAEKPFGQIYYDISGPETRERTRQPFEEDQVARRMPLGTRPLSIEGWLMRGAIREDDLMWPVGDNPQDDPYSTLGIMRVCNHFYDPINNQPLTIKGVKPCSLLFQPNDIAPQWAMGSTDVFASPGTPDTGRRNHFTVFDAREALYRALTGKGRDTSGNEFDAAPTKVERDKYWATLFRALGDIVHLVEDMAQPQHTRNDPHAGKKYDGSSELLGHKSVYESYVEARATGGTFEVPGVFSMVADGLTYDGYPTPHFTDYLSYFTTRHIHPDPNQITIRQGLADYSNRGFFSAGTNIESDNNVYVLPDRNPASYVPTNLYVDWQGEPLGSNPDAKVAILQGSVPDSLPGGQTATNIPLTTYGAWDQFLRPQGKTDYSLNRYNYDAMADLLIPRAVAYSAGFIDYFFRGRIEAEDAHYTDTGIELKVKNALDPETAPTEWQNEKLYAKTSSNASSTLRVAYEYKDENGVTRYGASDLVNLKTDAVNGDDDIAPGKVSREVYSFPLTVPSGKIRNLKYRLVFRGKLGQEEDAVVVGAFKPASGFLVTPNYPPQDGIPGTRMVYKTATSWKLAPDEGLVAGNIDWKGWYENGKPTKVLSWMGPTSRYFGTPPHGGLITSDPNIEGEENLFTSDIYHNGEVFSVAPLSVLGVALTKDSQGKVWLVAVCRDQDDSTIVVYRRPYKKSASAAIYNPETAKDGWREIGRSSPVVGDRRLDTPWFFKGDGTEAQAMRKWIDPNDPDKRVQLKRLIVNVNIDAPSATVSPKNNDPVGFVRNTQCSANYDADGAGTGTITYSESGSYVIAVDYNDMNEVLATVDENASGNTTTTVTVTKDANGNVTSTKTNTTLSENQAASLTQSPGGSPLTLLKSSVTNIDGVSSDTYKMAEITYYLDLRKKLYVYYEQGWNQTEQKVSHTTASGTGDYAEHMYVLPELPPDLFHNEYSYSYTTQITHPDGVFSCASSYPPTTRYEPNFGSVDNLDIGGGGWAVDAEGNVLVSQKFYSDAGFEVHDTFNYLKNGDINTVLGITAGAPAYYPVGVLY
jgi:hypothetical protein